MGSEQRNRCQRPIVSNIREYYYLTLFINYNNWGQNTLFSNVEQIKIGAVLFEGLLFNSLIIKI